MPYKYSYLLPLFAKFLQTIFFSALILYFAKTLFIPLFFGLLIAMVMYPICKWLEERKWQKSIAILTCLLIVTILFVAILILLVWQINLFSKDAPLILHKIEVEIVELKAWIVSHFGLTSNTESNWREKMANSLGNIINTTFQTTINTLFTLFLIPVYAALFLYHRKIFVEFLQRITPANYQQQLSNILKQTIHTYFNYIKGMILVYIIVGVLNSLGLWALGVEHALLFGMLCAIMTIIPYVGIFISSLLPISLVWMQTGNIIYPLGVIAVFSFVQFLEANIIFPKVVGTQLHVSTLAMLIAIILGGIIWGVAGMVLFIPFVAILKIVSDNIEELKPLNLLLSRK
jgi:predicted PurR-regulated permease PerM